MFDVATDPVSIQLIGEFAALDKTISAVCHGPAAFVNVFLPSGKHFLEGKKLTGLSNAEEDAFQMSQYMPFALETKLNEASGGLYTVWNQDAESATVVVENDGKFITGQNPKSGKAVGEAILKAIGVN